MLGDHVFNIPRGDGRPAEESLHGAASTGGDGTHVFPVAAGSRFEGSPQVPGPWGVLVRQIGLLEAAASPMGTDPAFLAAFSGAVSNLKAAALSGFRQASAGGNVF